MSYSAAQGSSGHELRELVRAGSSLGECGEDAWRFVQRQVSSERRERRRSLYMIVPAAGKGSRLGSGGPKTLTPVGGLPMLHRLVWLAQCIGATPLVVVSPDGRAEIASSLARAQLSAQLVVQEEPRGMGLAVLEALRSIEDEHDVLLVWGDMAATRYSTLAKALYLYEMSGGKAGAIVPTVFRRDPYVCLKRDEAGELSGVVQTRVGDVAPEWGESDIGVFCCDGLRLRPALERLVQRVQETEGAEVDFLPALLELQAEAPVVLAPMGSLYESVSVNSSADLSRIELYYRKGGRICTRGI